MEIWAHAQQHNEEENEMKRFLKLLTVPVAFASMFLLFGAPSAPGANLVPTAGGAAHAYGSPCLRTHQYRGRDTSAYRGSEGIGAFFSTTAAVSWLMYGSVFGVGVGGGFQVGIGTGETWFNGC